MPQLLTLSRAARLVGVRRGALQSKVRSGELAAFEGMVSAADLQRAYPQSRLEDSSGLERIERIKDDAFAHRLREHLLPSAEALAARLTALSRERAEIDARCDYYRAIVQEMQAHLQKLDGSASPRVAAADLLAWLNQRLQPGPQGTEPPPMRMQEDFLKIMTAHVTIKPSGHEFFVEGNDSLLEAALRAGLALDYGCSAGSCGKCKARVLSGQVQRTRHSDYALTAAEKNAGVVLMCCNTAVVDVLIEAHEAHGAADMPPQCIDARVKSVTPITADMQLLHLQTPRTNRLRFLAGQSVSLELPGGVCASLPVASCPCDDRNLQFHIGRREGDAFADRIFQGQAGMDTMQVKGPSGTFVLDEDSIRPLVFIAGDAGFAPVKSLIEHALALDAAETLHLYWITPTADGHYLDNLCRSWGDALDNFRYAPLTLNSAWSPDAVEGVLRQALVNLPRLEECDVYVAGPGELTRTAEWLLLDHGLPRAQLFLDVATG